MLRDKKSVVTPHSKIQKSHAALTFLRVRETIAVGIISYCFIYGSLNPAYTLRKNCIRDNLLRMLQLLIFCQGKTVKLFDEE